MSTCLLVVAFSLLVLLEVAGVIVTIRVLQSHFRRATELVDTGVDSVEARTATPELSARALQEIVEDPTSYTSRSSMERFVKAVNLSISTAHENARRRDAATLKAITDVLTEGQKARYLGPCLILAGLAIGAAANIAALYS